MRVVRTKGELSVGLHRQEGAKANSITTTEKQKSRSAILTLEPTDNPAEFPSYCHHLAIEHR